MMYCTGCGKHQEDSEFWSERYQRHVARCMECRRVDRVVEQAVKVQRAARTPETMAADQRRPAIGGANILVRPDHPNVQLIPDAKLAGDLAWVFENNPGLGRS